MIDVVGGTYDEICFEPDYKEKCGSGVRACRLIHTISPKEQLRFHTLCNNSSSKFLKQLPFSSFPTIIPFNISFSYDHPLAEPRIYPRLDTICKTNFELNVTGENILCYGLIEGNFIVNGTKVVYDPQSPVAPRAFSETKSHAEELVYVLNLREAAMISKSESIEEIRHFFLVKEKAKIIVLKMGAKGALVIRQNQDDVIIPVYKTNNVWPIGSGDIFTAAFAFYWFEGKDVVNAAELASWHTACFCEYRDYISILINSEDSIQKFIINEYPKKQVYLAGPFFTFAERWLIEQIRNSMLGMKLRVFSPLHDVGFGEARDVVHLDLQALEESSIVFAVLDGLDSGTLFEIGYAIKMGIPVIAYVENESVEAVKMLEGTNCILEKDLTTAIYKCFWKLSENE